MADYHFVIEKKIEDDGPVRMEKILDTWFEVESGRGKKVLDSLEEYVGLRPEVLAFARLMEAKLRKHDHDRGRQGWKDDSPQTLWDRLDDEVRELSLSLRLDNAGNESESANEAADVANFAMMIADVVGGLKS